MEQDVLDQLYTMNAGKHVDSINPTIDGSIIWQSIQSMNEYSEANFDNWKQGRYENFSRRCTTISLVRWIGDEIGNYPIYDGTSYLHNFFIDMEENIVAEQRVSTLDIALRSSPTR